MRCIGCDGPGCNKIYPERLASKEWIYDREEDTFYCSVTCQEKALLESPHEEQE